MSQRKILIINGGSSSIKYQLMDFDGLDVITSGLCERIFVDGNFLNKTNGNKTEVKVEMKNHDDAFNYMIDFFIKNKLINNLDEIVAVGHRVVHGGKNIKESMVINDKVKQEISNCIKFAPLHNEPELKVIDVAMKIFNKAKHVAVFDTSFHSTIPDVNKIYAVPREWYEEYGVMRYGMHGTSHHFICLEMQKILNKKDVNIIVCHLGNGASITAIKNSKSYNTSMGLTPLEGLIMGTRSGDIDPAIIDYMCSQKNVDVKYITNQLNKNSGMLGLTGMSDFRDIEEKLNNKDIRLALDIYEKRIVDYIVRYINDLDGNVDAIVFTAGVGENDPIVRKEVIDRIKIANIKIDDKLNSGKINDNLCISTTDSKIKVYVVRTNEELMIAKEIKRLI